MASATPSANPSESEPEKKKTVFDIVLTSTPVVLTVVATFLVGQSTGEMTRAQYFRAVASQNQSKAGDQWGFFQSKRIRGQGQEMAASVLMAQNRTLFTRSTFLDVAQGMVEELQSAEATALIEKEKAFAAILKELIPKAKKTRDEAKALFEASEKAEAALDALLGTKTRAKRQLSKDAAGSKPTSESEEGVESTEQQALLLKAVIADIAQKKPESEIAKKILKLKEETLEKAIADSDRRSEEINKRGKNIDIILAEFDALKDQQLDLAREYQQNLPTSWHASQTASRHTEAIRTLTGKLLGDYMAARLAYGARRYEDDARSNQDSAYLYEVKVYHASAQSNKHLNRSKLFLYAMLAAQAGVTISTLALAVRRKSIFWGLAALTGLIAVAFGAYVYLDLDLLPISKI